ncbi:50S ribosomal protein L25/general stress protein Ctc [Caldifermentibacillus hisashii]|uniref:50S ribosomal protein L25/general stress protein Ctc n=1 Tax=Caldifermentibacillus hisashii TaxID=996558 RepID=UPI0031B7DCA4
MSNTLVAEVRKDFRSSALHKIRSRGMIPAVVYGKHEETKPIAVKKRELLKIINEHGRNALISLDVDGIVETVILGEYQADPINQHLIHVDFLHVSMSSEIHAKVPVLLKGTAKGVEVGGVVQQSIHELNIKATPQNIPETIEVDVTNLEIGHTIKVGDIRNHYRNIIINHEDEDVIATIVSSQIQVDDLEEETSGDTVQATVEV